MSSTVITHHWIESFEKFYISAIVVSNQNTIDYNRKPVAIIAGATGVVKEYYTSFASFLVSESAVQACLLFDYRGVDSNIKNHWTHDTESCVQFLSKVYSGHPIVYIAHSVGGHILGFLRNQNLLTRVLFISVNNAFYKWWQWGKVPGYAKFLLNVVAPYIAVPTYGYYPSSIVGLGEDIPSNVGLQWMYWCNYKAYMCHRPENKALFEKCTLPIEFIAFSDDELSGFEAFDSTLRYIFSNSDGRLLYIDTQKAKLPVSPGHLKFFRSAMKNILWYPVLQWIGAGEKIDVKAFEFPEGAIKIVKTNSSMPHL
ncbi:hypothetical protein ROZALSC1DRAFT_28575 [Rozella allomycis CSF55]|uniref:AB hydrolase-1 domain-containing protein n=1 Tax=Rozella allomycis (strain CSF55) TaxID=988480 RepID=A0A4P9YK94_ROZAC|nr:hypothetical protein ROZALSC1DRAFT_28575 [Rozella allomycis CSF55]